MKNCDNDDNDADDDDDDDDHHYRHHQSEMLFSHAVENDMKSNEGGTRKLTVVSLSLSLFNSQSLCSS